MKSNLELISIIESLKQSEAPVTLSPTDEHNTKINVSMVPNLTATGGDDSDNCGVSHRERRLFKVLGLLDNIKEYIRIKTIAEVDGCFRIGILKKGCRKKVKISSKKKKT